MGLTIEHDFDQWWKAAYEEIIRRKSSFIFGIDNSGDYEDAFQLILDSFWERDKTKFYALLEITLEDFVRWDEGKTDLKKIIDNLTDLNMPQSQLESLTSKTKLTHKQIQITQKQIEFNLSEVKIDEKLCFIIMPFSDKLDPIYNSIIKPVIKDYC